MNPNKVKRDAIKVLTDLPNIGKAMMEDLLTIGIKDPSQLLGKSAYDMYNELCRNTGTKHDPCVIDIFLSITHFMEGDAPQPWWKYTQERKDYLRSLK